MANVQQAGFQPLKRIGGGFVTYRRERVLTNNTTAIALNDAVIQVSTGDVVVCATGTTLISSVSAGVSYIDANASRVGANKLPAATLYTSSGVDPYNATYISVVDDCTDVVFRASVDEAIALTDLNLNYAIVLGANVNGISQHELDATGRAVTATIPIRVTGFVISGDNDPDAADASVYCVVNAGQKEPALSASLGT